VFSAPRDVVGWLGAVQAQDFSGAKWALGLRLQGSTEDEVEQAFTHGAILRTHVLRPTWHFVTPADIRWLLKLTAPRVHAANAHMYRKLELDNATFKRSHAALLRGLQGGHQYTRDELREGFRRAGITAGGELRMGYLMMRAELDGIVCSGARRGKQFTYALLEERVPPARTPSRQEALAELARRYFTSRGPATVHDFAKWSGLTVTDARNGLESIKDLLHGEVRDRQTYWFPESTPATKMRSLKAFLLSVYDEYISSYKDRSAIVTAKFAAKLVAQGNALNYVVVIGGQIVGTWKRTFSKGAVTIEMTLFRPLNRTEEQAVTLAANRYGEFVGLAVISVR
jgi:Winged helix DNA-binding domain